MTRLLKVFVGLLLCSLPISTPATTLASWYGKQHRGHKTASGEQFNPDDLTAASWIYPFGTLLKVTNLKNHKSVVVRVSDRGPGVPGRGLDVSECAAELLGFKHAGLARVTVEVVK